MEENPALVLDLQAISLFLLGDVCKSVEEQIKDMKIKGKKLASLMKAAQENPPIEEPNFHLETVESCITQINNMKFKDVTDEFIHKFQIEMV